jgi:hypothetical protein
MTMKEPSELLGIEYELYQEFQRCGAQLLFEKMQRVKLSLWQRKDRKTAADPNFAG